MQQKVTLKDIARALNISIGTVERALHNRRGINPDTKRMVLEKARELDYRSNKHARSLSLKKRKKIAVIMPYSSDFWYRMKEGIEFAENEMGMYGVDVKYVCLKRMDSGIVDSYLGDLMDEGIEGAILSPVGIENIGDKLDEFIDNKLPVVMLNDDIPGSKRLFYVGPDNRLIGRLAGELSGKFSSGKGNCLIVSGKNIRPEGLPVECRERIEGFREVIEGEYPGMEIDIQTYPFYLDDAYNAAARYLENRSDIACIYSADGYLNEVAMAVKKYCKKKTVLVGHEMSEEVNRHLNAGIISATICQNPFLQGYYALRYMFEYLVDNKLPPNERNYINFNIFTRYNSYGRGDYTGNLHR